jgi:hypothetical protein
LPDGIFSNQKSNFGYIFVGLGMEKVGIFYDHFEYFTAIWYILWPFGIRSLWSFGKFFPFWYVETKKNLATLGPDTTECAETKLTPNYHFARGQ